jgi:hypothetical protein
MELAGSAFIERTIDLSDDAAYQRAVQVFVNELRPWVPPIIGRAQPHARLFVRMEIEEETGQVSVEFTPEGLACFRGWLRRQGLDPILGMS